MNSTGITNRVMVWQQLQSQIKVLVARLPGIKLCPDSLALMPFEELVGTLAFLKRTYSQNDS